MTSEPEGNFRLSFRPEMLFCDGYVLCTDRRRRTLCPVNQNTKIPRQ